MSAPRIDTVRRQIADTIHALHSISEELDDLHSLAYDRTVADRGPRVHGGHTDYALDAVGLRAARDAYRHLAELTLDRVADLEHAARKATRLLRSGEPGRPRTRRTITAAEHTEALAAQARARARGDYVPVRRHPQPDPGT